MQKSKLMHFSKGGNRCINWWLPPRLDLLHVDIDQGKQAIVDTQISVQPKKPKIMDDTKHTNSEIFGFSIIP